MPTNTFSMIQGIRKFNNSILFDHLRTVLNNVFIVFRLSRMLNKLILCLCLAQYTLSPWSGSPDPTSHDRVTSHDGQVRLTCTVQISLNVMHAHARLQGK